MKNHIFDLDGTLVDSMSVFNAELRKTLEQYNIPDPDQVIRVTTPMGFRDTAAYMQKVGVPHTVDEILQAITDLAVTAYGSLVKLKPYVYDYLTKLKKEGKRMFVFTATPAPLAKACLENNGVLDFFESVHSADEFSLPKTDPDAFLKFCAATDCTIKDSIMYDDNKTVTDTASKAGLHVVTVFDSAGVESFEKFKTNSKNPVESFKGLI